MHIMHPTVPGKRLSATQAHVDNGEKKETHPFYCNAENLFFFFFKNIVKYNEKLCLILCSC